MIIYTMMPQELIFPYEPEENTRQMILDYNGVQLLAERVEDGYSIVRILSSNPEDFMQPGLAPGTKISII